MTKRPSVLLDKLLTEFLKIPNQSSKFKEKKEKKERKKREASPFP